MNQYTIPDRIIRRKVVAIGAVATTALTAAFAVPKVHDAYDAHRVIKQQAIERTVETRAAKAAVAVIRATKRDTSDIVQLPDSISSKTGDNDFNTSTGLSVDVKHRSMSIYGNVHAGEMGGDPTTSERGFSINYLLPADSPLLIKVKTGLAMPADFAGALDTADFSSLVVSGFGGNSKADDDSAFAYIEQIGRNEQGNLIVDPASINTNTVPKAFGDYGYEASMTSVIEDTETTQSIIAPNR